MLDDDSSTNIIDRYTNSYNQTTPAPDNIDGDNFEWRTQSIFDIGFNENIYDKYKKTDKKPGGYGFVIYICNSEMPEDKKGIKLDFTDKNDKSLYNHVMPYLYIRHHKIEDQDISESKQDGNDAKWKKSIFYQTNEDHLNIIHSYILIVQVMIGIQVVFI